MNKKPFYESKILWTNLIILTIIIAKVIVDKKVEVTDILVIVGALANGGLRFKTDKPLGK